MSLMIIVVVITVIVIVLVMLIVIVIVMMIVIVPSRRPGQPSTPTGAKLSKMNRRTTPDTSLKRQNQLTTKNNDSRKKHKNMCLERTGKGMGRQGPATRSALDAHRRETILSWAALDVAERRRRGF